jgi:gluconolactonase
VSKLILPIESFEIFATGLDHPECLAFDRDGMVWAGGEAGQVYRIDSSGRVTQVGDCGGFNAGLAWTPDNRELYLCNARHGVIAMAVSGEWSVVTDTAESRKLVCPNYGVFTRRGDYYFTDSGNWKRRNGRLLCRQSSGSVAVIVEPFGYANGLALSEDEQHLFMAESDTDSIHRVDLKSGAVEVYAESVGRMPDGLALDAAGYLYACCYASDDIHKIDAAGRVERFAWDRWAILLSRPTNMAFYEDYLYVCNLGRTTITRAWAGIAGSRLANLRTT